MHAVRVLAGCVLGLSLQPCRTHLEQIPTCSLGRAHGTAGGHLLKELWPWGAPQEHGVPKGLQPRAGLNGAGQSVRRKEQQRGAVKHLAFPMPLSCSEVKMSGEQRCENDSGKRD